MLLLNLFYLIIYLINFIIFAEINITMKTKPIYKSVQAYADLCGISFQSVIQRQRYGHLEFTYHETAKNPFGNPVKMIDIEKYPPVTAKKRGRKSLV